MNILHVIPGLTRERGGPSAVVEALARHQVARGHRVTVLTTDQGLRNGEHATDLADTIPLERLAVRGPDRLAYAPRFRAAARSLVRASDLVHVHSIFTYPVHVTLREAAAAGVPVVLRPCGLLHRYSLRRSRWVKRAYLGLWGRMVRRACAAWHYTSAEESAQSWPHDGGPRFVLPNGIDPERFAVDRDGARRAVARRWPAPGDSPYVLFLGRLHPKKRPGLLVEAFLAGAPREFKLVVAGPDEAGLWPGLSARLLRQPAAAGRVLFVGPVSGPDKVDLLAGAALFALPSEHENFGVAALEALAAGTPVLLSPHVDLAGAAVAAGVGRTAPLCAEKWAARLGRLLAEPGDLAAMAGRARAWVGEHYAWGRIADELLERYQWASRERPARDLSLSARCASAKR
jgi:glycosyltransferase involved in cell wall biosynthesis